MSLNAKELKQRFPTIADLKSGVIHPCTETVEIGGYVNDDGCGGGLLRVLPASSTEAVNGGTVFADSAGTKVVRDDVYQEVWIEQFGGKGDNSFVNDDALDLAFAYANSFLIEAGEPDNTLTRISGICIRFGNGIYRFTKGFELPRKVKIEGISATSTVLLFDADENTNALQQSVTTDPFRRLILKNIQIKGTKQSPFDAANRRFNLRTGLSLLNGFHYLEDVYIEHCDFSGMEVESLINASLNRVSITECRTHCVYYRPGGGISTTTSWNHCYFRATRRGACVVVQEAISTVFDNCAFEQSGQEDSTVAYGLHVIGIGANVHLHGGHFESNEGPSIRVEDSARLSVESSDLLGIPATGTLIEVDDASLRWRDNRISTGGVPRFSILYNTSNTEVYLDITAPRTVDTSISLVNKNTNTALPLYEIRGQITCIDTLTFGGTGLTQFGRRIHRDQGGVVGRASGTLLPINNIYAPADVGLDQLQIYRSGASIVLGINDGGTYKTVTLTAT